MTYVAGFVAAVPAANKEAYRKHAADAAPLFKEFGATRMVEAWGDDVPDGKVTDFKGAVKAKPDEVVVFSWMEFPSKDAHAAASQKMMSDPRMKEMGANMPFDGKRMIYGGSASLIDDGARTKPGYVDGYLCRCRTTIRRLIAPRRSGLVVGLLPQAPHMRLQSGWWRPIPKRACCRNRRPGTFRCP